MLDSFFKKALGDAKSKYAAKVKECQSAKREREELAAAPGTREDVIDLLTAQIDRDGALYSERLYVEIDRVLNFAREIPIGPGGGPARCPVVITKEYPNSPPLFSDVETSMYFLFGKELKKAVSEAVFAMPNWPASTQPLKGRRERLAKLDSKIAGLEQEIAQMRAEATEAGVILAT